MKVDIEQKLKFNEPGIELRAKTVTYTGFTGFIYMNTMRKQADFVLLALQDSGYFEILLKFY